MALVTALWWIAALTALLLLGFQWVRHEARLEDRISTSIDSQCLAEGVLAREIVRLKKHSWPLRWYHDPTDVSVGRIHAREISGEIAGCQYRGTVQDVADFWRGGAQRLPYHTDLFVQIRTPEGDADHFFWRLVFRVPDPVRSRGYTVRRFARLAPFDPANPADRERVVAAISREERSREANRATFEVLSREIARSAASAAPLHATADRLAALYPAAPRSGGFLARSAHAGVDGDERSRETRRTPANGLERSFREMAGQGLEFAEAADAIVHGSQVLEEQIIIESQVQQLLKQCLTFIEDPEAGAGRFDKSVEVMKAALELADAMTPTHRAQLLPRCMYTLGRAQWFLARTHPEGSAQRTGAFDAAEQLFEGITRGFPWDERMYPTRFEAPHAYQMHALTKVTRAPPFNPDKLFEAHEAAFAVLDKLRAEYSHFHLYGEGGIFCSCEGKVQTSFDRMLTVPTLVLGGVRGTQPDHVPTASILRWRQDPRPEGEWLDDGSMVLPRAGAKVALIEPRAGSIPDSQIVILGGYHPASEGEPPGKSCEIYDPWTHTSRRLKTGLLHPRLDFQMIKLPDGTLLLVGGEDLDGKPQPHCEIFDPRTETFTEFPSLNVPRTGHRLVMLGPGSILVAGGDGERAGDTGEVIDVTAADASWVMVRNFMSRPRRDAVVQMGSDGNVLIAGGRQGDTDMKVAELYMPLPMNLFFPGKRNGDLLIMLEGPPISVDVFGPQAPVGAMADARSGTWRVSLISGPNRGKILLGPARKESSTEFYDARRREFHPGPRMHHASTGAGWAELPEGHLLLAGSHEGTAEVLRFEGEFVEAGPMPEGRRGAAVVRAY